MKKTMLLVFCSTGLVLFTLPAKPVQAQVETQWIYDGPIYIDPTTVVNQFSGSNSKNTISSTSMNVSSITSGTDKSLPQSIAGQSAQPNTTGPGSTYANCQATYKQNFKWAGTDSPTSTEYEFDVPLKDWSVIGSASQTGNGNSVASSRDGLETSVDYGSCSAPGSNSSYNQSYGNDPDREETTTIKNTYGQTSVTQSWVLKSSASGTGSAPASWSAHASALLSLGPLDPVTGH